MPWLSREQVGPNGGSLLIRKRYPSTLASGSNSPVALLEGKAGAVKPGDSRLHAASTARRKHALCDRETALVQTLHARVETSVHLFPLKRRSW